MAPYLIRDILKSTDGGGFQGVFLNGRGCYSGPVLFHYLVLYLASNASFCPATCWQRFRNNQPEGHHISGDPELMSITDPRKSTWRGYPHHKQGILVSLLSLEPLPFPFPCPPLSGEKPTA